VITTSKSDGTDVRDRILLKAREKFSTLGFSKTSMDEIAAELGMSKKTLYKFFATKRALAEAMIEQVFAQVNSHFDAMLASPLPAIEKLHRIVKFLVEQQLRFMTRAMLEGLFLHLPHLWRRIERFRRARMQKNMEAVIAQALQEGTVRDNFDREMFLHFLVGAIQEGLSAEVIVNASYSTGEAIQGLIDLFLNGILTPAGRRQYRRLHAASSPAVTRTP
jgi:AcrR family transcriptional regulator